MFKIVFSDVDGTLLNSNHVVSAATREAILDLKDIPFVIVSARSPSGIYPILRKNGFSGAIIAYSGALILDEHRKIVFQKGLSTSLASDIIRMLEIAKLPVTWCIYSGDTWLVKDKTNPDVIREENIVEAKAMEGTVQSVPKGEYVHKILCICKPGTIDEVEQRIREVYPEVNAVKSSDILLEIMDRTVNKAESVRKYCDYMGIDIQEAVAFGDNYNDIEMLNAVGYGVVMGNAPLDIRNQFQHITLDNDHDGIDAVLSQLFPGNS